MPSQSISVEENRQTKRGTLLLQWKPPPTNKTRARVNEGGWCNLLGKGFETCLQSSPTNCSCEHRDKRSVAVIEKKRLLKNWPRFTLSELSPLYFASLRKCSKWQWRWWQCCSTGWQVNEMTMSRVDTAALTHTLTTFTEEARLNEGTEIEWARHVVGNKRGSTCCAPSFLNAQRKWVTWSPVDKKSILFCPFYN